MTLAILLLGYSNIKFVVGTVVSLGLFNHNQPGDQVPLDVSRLEAPNDVVVMDYLTNESITIISDTAYLDGQSLCSGNISTTVRDAINNVISIEAVCGECGKLVIEYYTSVLL